MKTVVMGLGNDLLADDAVGPLVARQLTKQIDPAVADVVDTVEHGMALLDYFIGYDRAILIDAILTGEHPPGTVLEMNPDDFREVYAPSPHFAGLPELLKVADEMDIEFPRKFIVFAVEIVDPLTLGGQMTQAVRDAIPILCNKVLEVL